MPLPCPKDCSHRGTCHWGRCYCDPGFGGVACENEEDLDSVDAEEDEEEELVSMSLRGKRRGVEEKLQEEEEEVGVVGEDKEWEGGEEVDCGVRGMLHRGKCYCEQGWGGAQCAEHIRAVSAGLDGAETLPVNMLESSVRKDALKQNDRDELCNAGVGSTYLLLGVCFIAGAVAMAGVHVFLSKRKLMVLAI
jgi:hypothetical protein